MGDASRSGLRVLRLLELLPMLRLLLGRTSLLPDVPSDDGTGVDPLAEPTAVWTASPLRVRTPRPGLAQGLPRP